MNSKNELTLTPGFYFKPVCEDIRQCSPVVREVWDYILNRSFKRWGKYEVSLELKTSLGEIRETLKWREGARYGRYSYRQIKNAIKILKSKFIKTVRIYRGILIRFVILRNNFTSQTCQKPIAPDAIPEPDISVYEAEKTHGCTFTQGDGCTLTNHEYDELIQSVTSQDETAEGPKKKVPGGPKENIKVHPQNEPEPDEPEYYSNHAKDEAENTSQQPYNLREPYFETLRPLNPETGEKIEHISEVSNEEFSKRIKYIRDCMKGKKKPPPIKEPPKPTLCENPDDYYSDEAIARRDPEYARLLAEREELKCDDPDYFGRVERAIKSAKINGRTQTPYENPQSFHEDTDPPETTGVPRPPDVPFTRKYKEHITTETRESLNNSSLTRANIVTLYHKILPELPLVRIWGDNSRKNLIKILEKYPEFKNPSKWPEVFEQVRKSDFLMGRVKDFRASLSWILVPDNFEKIMSGQYTSVDEKGIYGNTPRQRHNLHQVEIFMSMDNSEPTH